MKINLPVPNTKGTQRLLLSNTNSDNENTFYLLMTFHKSKKGGFDYPVTIEDCQKALKQKDKSYRYVQCDKLS